MATQQHAAGIDLLFQVKGEPGARPGNDVRELTALIFSAAEQQKCVALHIKSFNSEWCVVEPGWNAYLSPDQAAEFLRATGARSITYLPGRKLDVYTDRRATTIWLARYDGV